MDCQRESSRESSGTPNISLLFRWSSTRKSGRTFAQFNASNITLACPPAPKMARGLSIGQFIPPFTIAELPAGPGRRRAVPAAASGGPAGTESQFELVQKPRRQTGGQERQRQRRQGFPL